VGFSISLQICDKNENQFVPIRSSHEKNIKFRKFADLEIHAVLLL